MRGRLCYECKHMWITEAEAGYSEYTPGNDFRMLCIASHWTFDIWDVNKHTFRDILRTAQRCPDYVPDPAMVEIGQAKETQ